MKKVELKNVTKRYKSTVALENISAEIKEKRIIGLIGPNGSGKTTFLRLITGLAKPTEGNIGGEAQIEGIIENPALYSKLSGLKNLKLKASLCDKIGKERINEVVELLGLKNRINDKVKTYSLGMKQRLGIAMAILNKPEILVLDEPMNGLDPSGMKELSDILLMLKENENMTLIVSSHLLNKLQEISDELIFIRNGKILMDCEMNSEIDAEKIYFELMEGNQIG